MSRKHEGFYHTGFVNASHKLKVIQKMKKMQAGQDLNKSRKLHETEPQKLPAQPKLAKSKMEKI